MKSSTIIKAGQIGAVLPRLSRVDLADHLHDAQRVILDSRQQAERIIAEARAEAQRLLTEARNKVEELHDRARREGAARGFAEGQEAGKQAGYEQALTEAKARYEEQVARTAKVLGEALRAFETRHEELLDAARQRIVDFAVQAAAKLTFRIGEMDRRAATANLERALALIGDAAEMIIRVHPADLEAMKTFASDSLAALTAARRARVVIDGDIAPGGCVVQAGATVVDATLQTQVEHMVAALTGRGEGHGPVH